MIQEDEIIEKLGIASFDSAEQRAIIEEATYRVGEAVSQALTEQQLNEYGAIVDDNEAVITSWLDQNVPDYKDQAVYQQFVQDYDGDPEKNNPAKLYASLAWVQKNIPNAQAAIDATLDTYKQEIGSA